MIWLMFRPSPNSIFDIYNPYGIKLLTRLRLGLNHLNEHKFKHGFNDTINPICICGGDIELKNHFFLHCPEYCEARQTLFDNIQSINKMLISHNESSLTHLLLTVTLIATPMLMHSLSAQQLYSYYLQEDSMDRYLTKLKMFFFLSLIHFSYGFLFVFVYLFCFVIYHLYLYPRCS